MDIEIRDLRESDLATANEIVMAAFRSPESRMADLRRMFEIRPEVWLMAFAQDAPVGTVLAVDYGPFAYVGDMTVRPQFQHRGIGSLLMNELLARLEMRGTPMVLLDASQAGAPLYAHLGLREADRACIYELVKKSVHAPTPGNVRPLTIEEADTLGEWDAPFFGANRSRVFRQFLIDFPGRAWVVQDENGSWSGYLFAQSRRLGPWVARRPQDAQVLLQTALAVEFTGPLRVIIPQMNPAGLALLERSGFQLVDADHRHMRRGGTTLPSRRDAIYGETSFGLG